MSQINTPFDVLEVNTFAYISVNQNGEVFLVPSATTVEIYRTVPELY
jgi:hypothetical protein